MVGRFPAPGGAVVGERCLDGVLCGTQYSEDVVDEPTILPSARKHGIGDQRMLHVVQACPLPLEHPWRAGQVLYLGPDQRGVPLEVGAFEDDAGELTIFHAMRMRPGYREAYAEVMQWL